jgi:hypothetical protein
MFSLKSTRRDMPASVSARQCLWGYFRQNRYACSALVSCPCSLSARSSDTFGLLGTVRRPLDQLKIMSQHPESHIRRAIRVLAMGELHKRGHQRLRVMPYIAPSGGFWRCTIGAADLFYRNHGAILREILDPDSGDTVARYSTAQENHYFDWRDAEQDNARSLVAEGFQMLAGSIAPSHAYVRVVEFGISVTIHSMEVRSGDLIHADRHGAVVVPEQSIDAMAAALDGLMKREAKIIAAARVPGATAASIKAAMKD